MASLSALHGYVPPLLTPVHDLAPFPALDVFGAWRLSMIINWIASGVFDPPLAPTSSSAQNGHKKKRSKGSDKVRPALLQELVGMAIVVFGPETFLGLITGVTPSWLVNPKTLLLFWGIHTLNTRTPLINLLPPKPSLSTELLLALPDAIGRTLLLTRFSLIPLLQASKNPKALPATPSTLILVPVIMAVPFASMMFGTFNIFTAQPRLTVPMELKPYGWVSPDTWAPFLCPAIFLTLVGPVKGWDYGLGWNEEEAIVALILFLWAVFSVRAIYNFGSSSPTEKTKVGVSDLSNVKKAQ